MPWPAAWPWHAAQWHAHGVMCRVCDSCAHPAAPSCSALAAPFSGALLAAMFPPLLTLMYLRAAAPSIPAVLPVVDVDAGAAGCGDPKLNPDAIGDSLDDDPVVDVDAGAAGLGALKLNPDAIGDDAPDDLLAPPAYPRVKSCFITAEKGRSSEG